MKKIIIGLSVFVLASCHRNIAPQVSTVTKDSVVYKVVPHDTTIYIPGAAVEVHDTITSDIPGGLFSYDTTATNGNVKLHVNITKGRLTASCKADSLQKVIQYLSESLEEFHREKEIVEVPVKVPVNHIPKWVWYLLAANVAVVAWKFKTPLFTVIKRFVKPV